MVTKYPAIKIKLIRSRVVGNKWAEFAILTFKSYNLLKWFVETLQISEAEIEQILANNVS